jgi:hypothetical protein
LLKEIRENARHMVPARENMNRNYKNLTKMFAKYENENLTEYSNGVANRLIFGGKNTEEMIDTSDRTVNSYQNPFLHLYFWIKSEVMDITAMQQAIQGRDKLIEHRQKLISKNK